jgi:predicted RNA-binding Zn ribbon-like protein
VAARWCCVCVCGVVVGGRRRRRRRRKEEVEGEMR